jgi:hypothetical protein
VALAQAAAQQDPAISDLLAEGLAKQAAVLEGLPFPDKLMLARRLGKPTNEFFQVIQLTFTACHGPQKQCRAWFQDLFLDTGGKYARFVLKEDAVPDIGWEAGHIVSPDGEAEPFYWGDYVLFNGHDVVYVTAEEFATKFEVIEE